MDVPEHIGPDSLKAFAKECEASLLSGTPYHFRYPMGASVANWPVEAIKRLNQDFLSNLRGKGNVYALWVRENETWAPAYVGQRKLKSLRERLTQHLIVKSEQTGSMLDVVKKAVGEGKEIGVSLIKVTPDSLRLYVEAKILDEKKPELLWNTHG